MATPQALTKAEIKALLKEGKAVNLNDLAVDPDTGVVLGPIEPDFRVETLDHVNWVLEKITRAEAEADALKARLEIAQRELGSMIKQAESQADWFRHRYGPEIALVVKDAIEKKTFRGKTYRCESGSVQVKEVPAKLKVADEEKAISASEEMGWEAAVKTEKKFLLSGLPDDEAVKAKENSEFASELGLAIEPAGQKCYIETLGKFSLPVPTGSLKPKEDAEETKPEEASAKGKPGQSIVIVSQTGVTEVSEPLVPEAKGELVIEDRPKWQKTLSMAGLDPNWSLDNVRVQDKKYFAALEALSDEALAIKGLKREAVNA